MAFLIGSNTTIDDSRRFIGNGTNFFAGSLAGCSISTGGYNIAIGDAAGCRISTPFYNTIIGRNAGNALTTCGFNVIIGAFSAQSGNAGIQNVFIGNDTANCSNSLNVESNVHIGARAGFRTCGRNNVFIGYYSGSRSDTATSCFNVAVGDGASGNITTGICNVTLGANSATFLNTGCFNTLIGVSSGSRLCGGNNNVHIGCAAGSCSCGGSNNIYINNLGSIGTTSNETCIGNSSTASTFTFGNFTSQLNVTAYSDESLKENIERIQNALEKVRSLEGVTYNRNDSPDRPRHMGLIAQCVEKVIPEVIGKVDGKLTIAYGNLIALVVEAIKEIDERLEVLESK
jgi:hypothetical protein